MFKPEDYELPLEKVLTLRVINDDIESCKEVLIEFENCFKEMNDAYIPPASLVYNFGGQARRTNLRLLCYVDRLLSWSIFARGYPGFLNPDPSDYKFGRKQPFHDCYEKPAVTHRM